MIFTGLHLLACGLSKNKSWILFLITLNRHPKKPDWSTVCICMSQQRCRSQYTNLLHAKDEYLRGNAKESPTHPTDSARGLVEFSDTNTWQANLWSAGCFVMKPKYLQRRQGKQIRHSKEGITVSIDITFICWILNSLCHVLIINCCLTFDRFTFDQLAVKSVWSLVQLLISSDTLW